MLQNLEFREGCTKLLSSTQVIRRVHQQRIHCTYGLGTQRGNRRVQCGFDIVSCISHDAENTVCT